MRVASAEQLPRTVYHKLVVNRTLYEYAYWRLFLKSGAELISIGLPRRYKGCDPFVAEIALDPGVYFLCAGPNNGKHSRCRVRQRIVVA